MDQQVGVIVKIPYRFDVIKAIIVNAIICSLKHFNGANSPLLEGNALNIVTNIVIKWQ